MFLRKHLGERYSFYQFFLIYFFIFYFYISNRVYCIFRLYNSVIENEIIFFKKKKVLLTKICTLNFFLLSVIVAFAIIYVYKCFSCLQLIFLFIITGNFLTFSVYMQFRLFIFSTYLGIT